MPQRLTKSPHDYTWQSSYRTGKTARIPVKTTYKWLTRLRGNHEKTRGFCVNHCVRHFAKCPARDSERDRPRNGDKLVDSRARADWDLEPPAVQRPDGHGATNMP